METALGIIMLLASLSTTASASNLAVIKMGCKSATFLLSILSFIFLACPVSGTSLTISPENPVVGEEITMRGLASPNEVLWASISFGKTVSVANGKYAYRLYDIEIPLGENNFAVTAEKVKNLNARVKILLWWTKSADATNGIATVSQSNVPSGTYDIRIEGDALDGESFVPLTITASSKITADPQGNFRYKYSSSGVPPGDFILSIGGITKTITLGETQATTSPAIPTYTTTPTPHVTPINKTPNHEIIPSNPAVPTAKTPGFEITLAITLLILALKFFRWKKT
jgi:hypothetical protein